MKLSSFILLFCFFILHDAFCQPHDDEKLFGEASVLYRLAERELGLNEIIESKSLNESKKELALEIKEKLLDRSLNYFNLLIKIYPQSNLISSSFLYKGYIEFALEDTAEAIKSYKRVIELIDTNLRDLPIVKTVANSNNKNAAFKQLALINFYQKNYEEAISFLDSTEKHSFTHFCGNAVSADDIFVRTLYAKSYLGQGKTKNALEKTLPYLFDSQFSDNSEIVDLVYSILKDEHTNLELQIELDKAFSNVIIEKTKKGSDEDRYFIHFFNMRIELFSLYFILVSYDTDIKSEIEKIKTQSRFYKIIHEQAQ